MSDLRKVKYKKWTEPEYRMAGGSRLRVEGSGGLSKDFQFDGNFHQWGNVIRELESGTEKITVGIVESSTGEIEEVEPRHIKFV